MNDMTGIMKQYRELERRITEAQKRLRQINHLHPLLHVLIMDKCSMTQTFEFFSRYKNMPEDEAIGRYASDIEKELERIDIQSSSKK